MNLRSYIPPPIIKILRKNFLSRLILRKAVITQKNFRLYVEITTVCNAKCLMCNRQKLIQSNKMSAVHMGSEIISKLLEDIRELTRMGYRFSFIPMGLGEPLAFPGLFDLFKKLKNINQKIYIILTTNGLLLNTKAVRSLIESGVDEITISLNAADKENYQKLMGVDKYDEVVKNIISLLKYKKSKKLLLPRISIQYLQTEYLKKSFWQLTNLWQPYLGSNDKVFFHDVVTEAGSCNFKNEEFVNLKKRYPCSECWSLLGIHINGDVYPCGPIIYWKEKKPELFLGNILKDSLYSIYFKNPKLHKIRSMMLDNDYRLLKTCRGCDNITLMLNPFFKNVFTKEWF